MALVFFELVTPTNEYLEDIGCRIYLLIYRMAFDTKERHLQCVNKKKTCKHLQ